MSYDKFVDGYALETTPGTSIIDGVGDTAYVLGAIVDPYDHPSPVAVTKFRPTGYNVKEVPAGGMWKQHMVVAGMYGFIMQNGIPCWMAMGGSSTAGADPYTHTIAPTTDGSMIPSFTFNHEQQGDATDEEYQFMGIKVDSLAMVHAQKPEPYLLAMMEVRGMQAQDGIALTTPPALPATANINPYVEVERIWDVGGTPVNIDGLERVTINIANGLRPYWGRTHDGGVYTGQWPFVILEKARKEYRIEILMHPVTVERRMWDSLISTATAITSTFKFIRSANDYILVTAVGPVTEHQLITPKDEELLQKVVIEPYDLNIEVKDSIVKQRYGEA